MARPKIDPETLKRRTTLAIRLKMEREIAKLSQQCLADLLGVPKIDVQRFENGAKVIPLDLLPKLCECLGVTAAQLLGDYRGLLTRAA
jgi:transcriptional regulator with XRE-family HTH domain